MHPLTDRNHLNLPPIGSQHTLPEKRAFTVIGRDSVPVTIFIGVTGAIARSIRAGRSIGFAAVSIAVQDDPTHHYPVSGRASLVKVSSVETGAPETSVFGRSQSCNGCSEGG
jgi:hypothetical protein